LPYIQTTLSHLEPSHVHQRPPQVQCFRAHGVSHGRRVQGQQGQGIEREGVPYQVVKGLIDDVFESSADFQVFVRLPKATFTKKMRDKALFGGTPGQSVVGLMELINKVEDMLAAETDNDEARSFDVQKWVGEWIQRPQPALGGLAPAELMDTPSGRASVMRVLGAIQSGAYQ